MKKLLLLLLACCVSVGGFAQYFTAYPSALSFPPTTVGTSSPALSSAITGAYLYPSSGSVTVSAPSNFLVGMTSTGTWVSSYCLTYTGGTLSTVNILAAFNPTSVSYASGNITITGGSAPALYIPVNGSGAPICSGTPTAGTVTASRFTACGSTAITISDVGYTMAGGLNFQWQSSPDSSTWSNISGATNINCATTVSATTYYRCSVTCSTAGSTVFTPGLRIACYTSGCPTLNPSTATVTFPTTVVSTPSSTMNIVFSGSALTPASGNIAIQAPANYSVYSGSAWVSSYNISYSGGVVSSDTIPVRFNAPSTSGTYPGNLSATGGGTRFDVSLTGTCAAACSGTPTAGTAHSSATTASTATHIILTESGYSATAGIILQWQSSPDSSTWTNIPGATTAVYNFNGITANTYFRCNVTCSYSSVTVSSLALLINYAVACSGMPSGGTASASSYYCNSCSFDTLSVSGYSTAFGNSLQWQKSYDGTTGWANISWATSSRVIYTPSEDCFYRCANYCDSSGLTAYSNTIHVAYHYRILGHAVWDSSTTICSGKVFYIQTFGNSPFLYVTTYYGDGQKDSVFFSPATAVNPSAYPTHNYTHSGDYSVKQIVYCNNIPQDSIAYTTHYARCHALPISCFTDVNGNGVFDSADIINSTSFSAEVDSNGVAVDTITATSGFYYPAGVIPGTVYRFRVIAISGGYSISCPSSGYIYDTISATVNTYPRKYFGLSCITASGFNLSEYTSLLTGRHLANGNILVTNSFCPPQNAVVTLNISPRYVFDWAYPTPASVVGNTVTWNLTGVSADSASKFIRYALKLPTSSWITPGDTVHTYITVTPTAGDIDTSDNVILRIDTIRSSYDPNHIEVTPAGDILNGTKLHFTIEFENDGNDTAHNISVLDTLSGNLDAATLQPVFASSEMYVETQHTGGFTIVKFDFPNIKLLDSSHHGKCTGMVTYTINARRGLASGAQFYSHAGIYFDDNPVVLTDTAFNTIVIPHVSVAASHGDTICHGDAMHFSANATSVNTPHFNWFVNSASAGSDSAGFTATGLGTGDTVKSIMTTIMDDTIYSTSNSIVITERGLPAAGVISGPSAVCTASGITLAETVSSGTWMASNSHATVSAGGVVTGVSVGLDTVYYTVSNVCGASHAMYIITVAALPAVAAITGTFTLCQGASVTLADSTAGGAWSLSNSAATHSGAVITGVSVGLDTVSYTVSNACGPTSVYRAVTIFGSVVPSVTIAASPSGAVCSGDTVRFTSVVVSGGSAPRYQWLKSGVIVDTTRAFSYAPANGDIVQCLMESNAACPNHDTVFSTAATMAVLPSVTPAASITVLPDDSVAYPGQVVTLYSEISYCGSAPLYQWYKNGSAVAGATAPSFMPAVYTNDTFYCGINCSIACSTSPSATSNTIVIFADYLKTDVRNAVGSVATFNLYPNPATTELTITTGGLPEATLIMSNSMGSVVMQKDLSATQTLLNIKALPAGIYYIKLVGAGFSEVRRFVKL